MSYVREILSSLDCELLKLADTSSVASPPVGIPGSGKLKSLGRTGRHLAIGAGVLGVGSYALGRGLQSGIHDRQKKEREEANRAASLSGNPLPYSG